ncbi:MAG: hypothetical protein ACQUHE_06030 [Bacteroidia bacterium]
MELLLSVAEHLYLSVKNKFEEDIKSLNLTIPKSENNFWNIKHGEVILFHNLIGEFDPCFLRDKVKYKSERRYILQSKKIINFGNDEHLFSYLTYLEFEGDDINTAFNNFLDSLDEADKGFQLSYLNKKDVTKKIRIPLDDIEQLLEDKAKLLSRLYSPRLLGEKFWFFFYGYEKFKGVGQDEETWPLVKLLFKFPENYGIELKVEIDNTFDDEHHDYVGKTDFKTSREEVLVINCRTYPDFFRQLNIKIHIGTGDGGIFLGQYMNYESEGRIISGSILLQRITDENSDLTPKVHHIPKLTGEQAYYTTDLEGIDKSIIQYLHNKKINFRRTSLRAGHNLHTLERWLKHQKDK